MSVLLATCSSYQKPDGSLYAEGDLLSRPQLADTLEVIANDGPDAFYRGQLADQIVQEIQDFGNISPFYHVYSCTNRVNTYMWC